MAPDICRTAGRTTIAMPGRSSCAAGKIAVLREYLDSYYIVRLFGKP